MWGVSKVVILVSSFLYSSEYTNDADMSDLINLYQDDLSDPVVVDQELQLWKNLWAGYLWEER